jgi:FkbM family methyltransferase
MCKESKLNDVGSRTVRLGTQSVTVSANCAYTDFWDRVEAGEWEPTTLRAIESTLTKSDTYIDVGAWIGPTVLAAAKRAGKVIAYEPDPVAAAELRLNIRLNDLNNVEVRETALFDRNGTMSFGSGNCDSLGESASSLMYGERGVEVQVKDASEAAQSSEFQQCTLLKIDVEGAEYALTKRIHQYLDKRRPILILSTHSRTISGKLGLIGSAQHFIDRLRLLSRLSMYRHSYIEASISWSDRNAKWLPLSMSSRAKFLYRLGRNNEFLFSDQRLPV